MHQVLPIATFPSPPYPTELQKALGSWYDQTKRDLPWRNTSDPYAIWISEVMLQQTRVQTVIPYYLRFMKQFPDAKHLAAAYLQTVYKLWEGLGYYSRARHLHQAASIIATEFDNRLPDDPALLLNLPGIGSYIAAAILSIAFDRPHAVVDGNVKRVIARLLLIEDPVNKSSSHARFQSAADQLLDRHNPARHNQAMMELGALVCTPRNPQCNNCPVALFCEAFKKQLSNKFPYRIKRPPIPEQHWAAGVIVKNGHILLTQRPPQGLLAGFWEFPCTPLTLDDDPSETCIRNIQSATGLQTVMQQHITTVRHTYTHFKLRMDVYLCQWEKGHVHAANTNGFQWVPFDQTDRLPLHKAVHKALPAILMVLAKNDTPIAE